MDVWCGVSIDRFCFLLLSVHQGQKQFECTSRFNLIGHKFQLKNGEILWFRVLTYKIKSSGKKGLQTFLVNDITESVKLEEEKKIIEKENQKNTNKIIEFTYLLSHELHHDYAFLHALYEKSNLNN